MKFKIKGKKPTMDKVDSTLKTPEKKLRFAKIKTKPMSSIKPAKKGKIIIKKSKGEGKYTKDENYYKAKMMKAGSSADEKKYYKLMRKMMDK